MYYGFAEAQGDQRSVMRLEQLRTEGLEANLELVRRGPVLNTFGNVSGISRSDGMVAIKPSSVPYESMKAGDIVITDLEEADHRGEFAAVVRPGNTPGIV